jgi:hypothetical protein
LGTGGDGATDLEYQPTAGFKSILRLRDETFDDFETEGARENSMARLELSNFELNLIGFGFTDVRRIGDDELERIIGQAGKEISFMKVDARGEVVAGGVGASDLKGGGRNVSGVNLRRGKLFGEGEGDRAGASADVDDLYR